MRDVTGPSAPSRTSASGGPTNDRSFRREPVVVHARRSPSNGRRGAGGAVVGFGTRGSGRMQSPPPFVVDVLAVHHLHQCQDSSGINQGHQPTARAAFTNKKPRIQKLLEPLDLQLITPEIKRRNRLAHETTFAHSAIRGSRWPFAAADRCLIKLERHAPKCPYPGQGRCRPR